MKRRRLNKLEAQVLIHKGTEPPFSGQYNQHFQPGEYRCRQCDALLFLSSDKFQSHCGWPAFDKANISFVGTRPDEDGFRTELFCKECQAHLGHLFHGEGFTPRNRRYCVNSISLQFYPLQNP